MKRILLLAALLTACAEQPDVEASTEALSGAAGSGTTSVAAACDALNAYARHYLDTITPGSLVCGGSSAAARYQCKTDSPPINYSVTLRSEQYTGNTCVSLVRLVQPSQSSCFQIGCTQSGATATCNKYGC